MLHVLPSGNDAYQQSLACPEHRALGRTVIEVWQRLLRRHDRFLSVDSTVFLDPSVTSWEYVLRYGDGLILDEPTLLRTYGVDTVRELEDVLDFGGDILAGEDGVELVVGCVGWHLPYPFFVPELQALVDAVEREIDEMWQQDLTDDEAEGDT